MPLRSLAALALLLPAMAMVAHASDWVGRRLERAQHALADGRFAAAHAALGDLQRNLTRLSARERTLMHETLGYLLATERRHADAAVAFERALDGDALPDGARRDVRYNLAQLHALLDRPDRALPHARAAVAGDPAPPESRLRLLAALLVREKRVREATDILRRLLAQRPADPKPYWLELSAAYAALGEHRRALGAMQAAWAQGLLDTPSEIVTLARLHASTGAPQRAAALLEASLENGTLGRSPRTLEQLADAWLQAREPARALRSMRQAAAMSKDDRLRRRVVELDAALNPAP